MGHRLGFLAVLTLALNAGCSSSDAGNGDAAGVAAVDLTADSDGADVTLARGQELKLTLQTIGPGQYGDPSISSSSALFEGMEFPSSQNPGGPTQIYRFQAVAEGSALITIPHDVGGEPFTLTLSCCSK